MSERGRAYEARHPSPRLSVGRGVIFTIWQRFHHVFVLAACLLPNLAGATLTEPRIVNIYNFVRNSDFRLPDSENVLFDATKQQIALLKSLNLRATWALQYDALMNPRYQKLFKEELGPHDEIAAWWEIPQPLAEKAGLKWRGEHAWDPKANVGFSPGYTPDERRKLVDAYLADFKAIFGRYPRTVGSWYLDEVTLAYMADRYHIVASCNCKDQIGTDFYTLWGGYWNQAYYPSRLNAYMPAQTRAGQIDVPIFRMLGSDPIYQHGVTPGMFTLEPVYPDAGGSPAWQAWFLNNLVQQPSLAFAWTQAGQENSFGWNTMATGYTRQMALIAELARAGKVQVETLAQAGQWFRKHHPLTPATAVVALDDWKHENRRTVWYDSRFYRLNVLWENSTFFIRDLHLFDESVVSPTHDTALTATSLAYETLPVMDWARWSESGKLPVGVWPVLLATNADGHVMTLPLATAGEPEVTELNAHDLSIRQPLADGGTFTLICAETNLTGIAVDRQAHPLAWAWNFVGGTRQKSAVQSVAPDGITYRFEGTDYHLQLPSHGGTCQQLENGMVQVRPNSEGVLMLEFGVGNY